MTRVCFLGNFQSPWCSEVHESLSLESLGCEVIRLQEGETDPRDVVETVKRVRPDIFWWVRTWGWSTIGINELNEIHKVCPSVFYHLDLIRGIPDRESRIDTDAQYRCSYVFLPDGDPDTIKFFKQHGVNHFYSPPAVYDKAIYLAEPDPELKEPVIFVGAKNYHSTWQYRGLLLEKLEQQYGERFKLYEHSSQRREHALNVLYASAKVAVGDTYSPSFNRKFYFSDRLMETAGRGCAQVFPRIYGIWDYFEEGKEILTYEYNNWVDLWNKIDWLLDHEDERITMRDAAMRRCAKDHTYRHRLANVLNVVLKGEKNIYE